MEKPTRRKWEGSQIVSNNIWTWGSNWTSVTIKSRFGDEMTFGNGDQILFGIVGRM